MALVKDFSAVASSSVINMLIGLFTTPIITRIVEPADYGNWSLFCVYSNVAFSIILLGLDHALVRFFFTKETLDYKRCLLYKCLLISLTTLCVVFLPLVLGLRYSSVSWTIPIWVLYFMNIFLSILNRFSNLLLRFTHHIKSLSMFTILHKVFFVIIAICLILVFNISGLFSLILATVSSTLIIVIGTIYVDRDIWHMPNNNNLPFSNKELLSYSIPLMVASGVFLVFQATDKIIIKQYCTDDKLGIYASAASIIALLIIVQNSFDTVWWPTAMKRYESDQNNKVFLIKVNEVISFSMLLLGLMIILFKDVIVLFLGPNYRGATVVIPFLMFQPILQTISQTTAVGLTFMKKSHVHLLVAAITLTFNIPVNIYLTKLFGIVGTSIAVAISYFLYFFFRTIWSQKYYRVPYKMGKLYLSLLMLFIYAIIQLGNPDISFSIVIAILILITYLFLYRKAFIMLINKYK